MRIIAAPTTTSARLCPKCGAKIYSEAPAAFCSPCLLQAGLDLLTADDSGPSRESIPTEFGDYELLGEIGRGGQGVVFRARQKSLNRIVALKVIGLGQWANETHLKRFRREAEAAASLKHPRIIPIYEIGERDGACFFSMPLVEGGQLDELVRREPLPLRRAAEIVASLARTVHHAHERGILHRDIKPGNILLDPEGEPHLADFGLARLVEMESTVTRTLEVLGTPSYIAPEQAAGKSEQLSRATDVYGLGAVFYQLLTGHPPFAGGTTYETIRLVLETEPRNPRLWNPKVDRDLTTICLKCLEKNPQRRYASALAVAEDLERWLGHEPVQARPAGIFYRGRKWIRRNPTLAALIPLAASLLGAVALLFWNHEPKTPLAGIAVLPFANLDGNKSDTVFADGIQDDILMRLARIADLKVISRTSVMNYRGARNTRQIGDALHVSHLLEGSVRRDAHRIRLSVELIDARSDQQVWAEEYDRSLNDVSAVQSDIAQQVADELHVKLSPDEKAAIAKQPTKDLSAYSLYVCAAALIDPLPWGPNPNQDALRGIDFLNQAIARDPAFLLAFCKLAQAHDYLYGSDHTPDRLALADSAVKSALRLGPDSGDAHLALALHLYGGYLGYDRARAEIAIAGRALPNDPRIFRLSGFMDRRQGRWTEAVHELEHAVELDPRNARTVEDLAGTYLLLRAYKQASDTSDRALALNPTDIGAQLSRAWIELHWRADTRSIHAMRQKIMADDPALSEGMAEGNFRLALFERDLVGAERALAALVEKGAVGIGDDGGIVLSHSFCEALLARMKGDGAGASAAILRARAQQEELVHTQPDYGPVLSNLGLIDAQLGRKEEALQEGRRAIELMPVSKNSLDGAGALYCFAIICGWTGERDLAFEQLEILAKLPAGSSYGDLRLNPFWDPLRDDPRFEKIVRSLAPNDGKIVAQHSP